MLNFSHANIKSHYCPLFLRAVFAGVACFLAQQSPALAQNYDIGDPYNGQSAGGGVGLNGVPNTGNTNVRFEDFGFGTKFETPNLNPQYTGAQPIDLLPINQQNTVEGMNIYSRTAQDVYGASGNHSGTSYSQAPQVDPGQAVAGRADNPYLPGAKTLLPPVTTGLQAQYQPNALVPIGASKFSFGFNKGAVPTMYNSIYQNIPGTLPSLPTGHGFSAPSFLPPASLGSVDINVVGR
jgi:hypothetical protein